MVISAARSRQRRRAEHAADGRRIDNYVLIGKKQKDRHRHDCDELGGEHNRDRVGKRGRRPAPINATNDASTGRGDMSPSRSELSSVVSSTADSIVSQLALV